MTSPEFTVIDVFDDAMDTFKRRRFRVHLGFAALYIVDLLVLVCVLGVLMSLVFWNVSASFRLEHGEGSEASFYARLVPSPQMSAIGAEVFV